MKFEDNLMLYVIEALDRIDTIMPMIRVGGMSYILA